MLRRSHILLLLALSASALAGCSIVKMPMPGPSSAPAPAPAPAPYGLKIPNAVTVDDGAGGNLRLQLASVVTGSGVGSGFGSRGYSMGGSGGPKHEGIDIIAPRGAPIRAAAVGYVVDMGWRGAYGKFVLIRHSGQIETAYAHLSEFSKPLAIGKWVGQDDIIGYVGITGNSTGPHLHYEVRKAGKPIDPLAIPAGIVPQAGS